MPLRKGSGGTEHEGQNEGVSFFYLGTGIKRGKGKPGEAWREAQKGWEVKEL